MMTGGVIQITSRRRRASKEINLETLAQKASEMEKMVKVKKKSLITLQLYLISSLFMAIFQLIAFLKRCLRSSLLVE